jgi:uncharacterized protein YbjT (DUF2867 family)
VELSGVVAVTGATGRQGGAVARHLLAAGRPVKALTRTPDSPAARALAALGAEVTRAEMDDPGSLREAFRGAQAVYSVQNSMTAGLEAEVAQGRNVADAAVQAGVAHLVQASAAPGLTGTGVGPWESKATIVAHARSIGAPLTVLHPAGFMELMTDKDFYPAVSTWYLMPRLMGEDTRIPWVCLEDLGAVAALVLADAERFVGTELTVASDLRSIRECRETWRLATGRTPRRFPMPVPLFRRFVGEDLLDMWRWLGTHDTTVDPTATRRLLPDALTVEQWVRRRAAAARPA